MSSLDWSAVTNKIVSCSHDRNAFVWTYEKDTSGGSDSFVWKPTLVILRIDRAAIDVKWSLDGQRFAVASSAKVVPVCMYEPANDWWVSKMVKKHKSTVLCCAFHPTNGQLMATGSSDFKCRVFSTFDADVDGTVVDPGPFPQPLEFGEVYAELSAQGWVNAIAWSPSGLSLAYAGHDCTLHVATFGSSVGSSVPPVVRVLPLNGLPLSCLVFLTDRALVGAGYDFEPIVFVAAGTPADAASGSRSWTRFCSLDNSSASSSTVQKGSSSSSSSSPHKAALLPPPPPQSDSSSSGGVAAARAMFQNKASRGQDQDGSSGGGSSASSSSQSQSALGAAGGGGGLGDELSNSRAAGVGTRHCRAITGISCWSTTTSKSARVCTSGMDGKLIVWDVDSDIMTNINTATLAL